MGEHGGRHPAENLIGAVALPVLHPVNLVPHDREQRLDEVGRGQALAQLAGDAQGMERESLLANLGEGGGGLGREPRDPLP